MKTTLKVNKPVQILPILRTHYLKGIKKMSEHTSFICQHNVTSAECNDMAAGWGPWPTPFSDRYSFETQYQENMISKRCELMYDTWRRTETNTCFNQSISKDGKFVIGLIGKNGGYLELVSRGIQLHIPPGAMELAGDAEYVFVYADTVQSNFVCYDVIICGPPGLTFSNSVLLRFPKSEPGHEELAAHHIPPSIKLSVQKLGDPMVWRSLDTSKDGFCFLEDGDVFLYLNHFTGIKANVEVTSTPGTHDQQSKTIYISAFLEQHDKRYLSLRVFCSTYLALKLVTKEESNSSSRRVGNPVKAGSYQSRDEVKIIIAECVDCRVEPSAYGKNDLQEPEFTSSPLSQPILSLELRRELSIQLDVLRESQSHGEAELRLCDYRGLANLMAMSECYINWLGSPKNCQSSTSPTIILLNKWEIHCRKRQLTNHEALNELEAYLKTLQHNTCIKIVNEYTKSMYRSKGTCRYTNGIKLFDKYTKSMSKSTEKSVGLRVARRYSVCTTKSKETHHSVSEPEGGFECEYRNGIKIYTESMSKPKEKSDGNVRARRRYSCVL
ncbi:uncharacterized protein LOC117103200 isoform X2 [Anneissia japonica]|uniref:uncharacterized protein LOC117103200 isoform X2 n=1 Tax=Anneissia japonica TaxID=1529436 RepID=UPI001425651D|nr:uncharacterized protein LOC117103200 isoform X2 [Anneissia japonica]